LLRSKVTLGADATVAAGPKGRAAMAATDAYMRAEILTYRSRGLFAGVSLEGSTLRQDSKANEKVYGHKITVREIVRGGRGSGQRLVSVLQKASPRNLSKPSSVSKKVFDYRVGPPWKWVHFEIVVDKSHALGYRKVDECERGQAANNGRRTHQRESIPSKRTRENEIGNRAVTKRA